MGYCVKSGGSGCLQCTGRVRVFLNQGSGVHWECCTLEISFAALSYLLSASGISLWLRGHHGKKLHHQRGKGTVRAKELILTTVARQSHTAVPGCGEIFFLALATDTMKHED